MATISKEKIYLKDKTEFMKVVKYSKGVFSIELPETLCQDLCLKENDKEVSANTEDLVNALFKQKLSEWDLNQTIVEKIICFRAKFQGALWASNATGGGKYETHGGSIMGRHSSSFLWHGNDLGLDDAALGLTIVWGVYTKRTFKGNSDYKFVTGRRIENRDILNGHKITQIPWTEEREKFFLELDESFARMIHKVHMALGDLTPEKLVSLTDSGMKLLSNQQL